MSIIMPKKIRPNLEILNSINDYIHFMKSEKATLMPVVVSKEKENHDSSLEYIEDLSAKAPYGNTKFECELRNRSPYNYSFQILSDKIASKVLFRMDEGNGTHRNRYANTLAEESVPCPHFHHYDASGLFVAYQTDELKKMDELTLEIKKGFTFFCKEAQINSESLEIKVQEENIIPMKFQSDIDPTDGVSFP
jgi:hypothetical protein